MTNMGDVHTCSIGGVHLIMTTIWLLSRELAHLVGEVVSSSGVHIPCWINGVGRSATMIMRRHGSGSLLVVSFAIVAKAQKILLVATMTTGGNVALKATQLVGLWGTTRRTARHRPVTTRDGWSIAPQGRL